MQYRSFGQINFKPSALGFGAMRLPIIGENTAKIDEEKATQMVHYAVDHGINYIDTAFVYHQGQSEIVLGKILKYGLRKKIKLATKLPIQIIENKTDPERLFNEQIQRLQTDYIDFYLFHALNQEKWQTVLDYKIVEWAEKKIAEGKIRHLGFSFHDELSVFKSIIDRYPKWSFCQIQHDFLNPRDQAGQEGLKYAAEKGLGIVIMSPLKGGKLSHAPKQIQQLWDKAPVKRSPAEWALSWLWNQPEVSLVLSGMSTLDQLKANIKYAEESRVNSLTDKEIELIEKVRQKYQELVTISCTKCGYCMPCPKGVNIPWIFELYNESFMFDNLDSAKKQYSKFKPEERAENCIQCRKCEPLCSQKINISEELKRTEKLLFDNK